MKRINKAERILSLMLSLLLLLTGMSVLSACNGEQTPAPDSDTSAVGTDSGEEGTQSLETDGTSDGERLTLVADGKTDYVLVRAKGANTQVKDAVVSFAGRLKEQTGVSFASLIYTDSDAPSEREIIIGAVSGRTESAAVLNSLNYDSYDIRVVGKKILVSAYSETMLTTALNKLISYITDDGNGSWSISTGLSFSDRASTATVDIPDYETSGELQGVYDSGSGNYELSYGDTSADEYTAYLAKLSEAGFTLYDDNVIGVNRFATYLAKNSAGEETAVYTMFYPNTSVCKIVYGARGYLPDTEEIAAPTGDGIKARASITQLGRLGVYQLNNGAPGLCYVIQLADGSYIVMDGGPKDTTVQPMKEENGEWVEDGEARESEDMEALYELLVSNNPDKSAGAKPVIAAWIVTHAHDDHIGLVTEFLKTYKNDIVLEMAVYNFPNYKSLSLTDGSSGALYTLVRNLESVLETFYPSTEIFVPHTGQELYFAGCEIEFLYTHEDLYPTKSESANDNSLAFRVTLNDTTFMVLGDCDTTPCKWIAKTYTDALKSDILQITHHGANGGDLELYQYINPDICFWPISDYIFYTNPQQLGTASGYSFNAWIRTNADTHYIENETHVVYCD